MAKNRYTEIETSAVKGPYREYNREVCYLVRSDVFGYKVEVLFLAAGFDEKLNCRKEILRLTTKSSDSAVLLKKILNDRGIPANFDDKDKKVVEVTPNIAKGYTFNEDIEEGGSEQTNSPPPLISEVSSNGNQSHPEVKEDGGEVVVAARLTQLNNPKAVASGLSKCKDLAEEEDFVRVKLKGIGFSVNQTGDKIIARGGVKGSGTFYYTCKNKYVQDLVDFLVSLGYLNEDNVFIKESKDPGSKIVTLHLMFKPAKEYRKREKVKVESTTPNPNPVVTPSSKVASDTVCSKPRNREPLRTFSSEVTISLSDNQFKEFLQGASEEELIEELNFRGSSYLASVPEEVLIQEFISRGSDFVMKVFGKIFAK